MRLADIAEECSPPAQAARRRQRPSKSSKMTIPICRSRLGRPARHPPDLPQSDVERAEVHAQRRPHHADRRRDAGRRSISLSVRDTGPGIPADEIPKVLQAFGQGSLAHQTAEGGTGLGLPIVQNLIELHGGSLRASVGAAQRHRGEDHPARSSACCARCRRCSRSARRRHRGGNKAGRQGRQGRLRALASDCHFRRPTGPSAGSGKSAARGPLRLSLPAFT